MTRVRLKIRPGNSGMGFRISSRQLSNHGNRPIFEHIFSGIKTTGAAFFAGARDGQQVLSIVQQNVEVDISRMNHDEAVNAFAHAGRTQSVLEVIVVSSHSLPQLGKSVLMVLLLFVCACMRGVCESQCPGVPILILCSSRSRTCSLWQPCRRPSV